jgi:hypothetical protein
LVGGSGVFDLAVSDELAVRAKVLDNGGPALWQEFMEELRELHPGVAPARKRKTRRGSVLQRLQAAYEAAIARRRSAKSHGIEDLPIGTRGEPQHHIATAKR